MSTTIIATEVKLNRNTPRIWLEGQRLARGAFTKATSYRVNFRKGVLTLIACKDGDRTVSGNEKRPVIDLNNKDIGEWFGVGTKLRAVIRRGRIVIRRMAIALKTMEREARVLRKLRNGEPLKTVSMFHGGGVMARAMHDGFKHAGIDTELMVVSEIEGAYVEASLRANADLFTPNTLIANAPVQEIHFDKVPAADHLEIALPCSGFSKAGVARRKLSCAEEHPMAGALFFSALEWIKAFQPVAVTIECTRELLNSVTLTIIRSVLLNLKYDLFETCLAGNDFGALENRKRAVIVAMSTGFANASGFKIEDIKPLHTKPATIAEVLEPIAEDDPRWKVYEYLETKEQEDIAKGNGFRRALYDGTEESICTITRGHQRVRQTDPQIKHPTKARYTRILTPVEHAAMKGIPAGWIESCEVADTPAHEILGQSVCYGKFVATGAAIGLALKAAEAAYQSGTAANDSQPATITKPQLALAV